MNKEYFDKGGVETRIYVDTNGSILFETKEN